MEEKPTKYKTVVSGDFWHFCNAKVALFVYNFFLSLRFITMNYFCN